MKIYKVLKSMAMFPGYLISYPFMGLLSIMGNTIKAVEALRKMVHLPQPVRKPHIKKK